FWAKAGGGVRSGSIMAQTIDPELMSILVCPESHARLIQVGDWLYSTDPQTRRRYPVREGLPIMLIDESEVVSPDEFNRVMQERQEKTANGNG
ncbi:MAG TPA: hypothetical protein PLS23_16415, partial [Phycisphaerae bacterium]|nr:hypothetical protein [Phycisphaerae bacterium]